MTTDVPAVLEAWGCPDATITPIHVGLINLTFQIDAPGGRFVLQRLHPVFRGEVNQDIDAITQHLVRKGIPTPTVVPTRSGQLWHDASDGSWRMLTWLPQALVLAPTTAQFKSAGALVGRFHEALLDLAHSFVFSRPGAHDTAAHLARLEAALDTHRDHRDRDQIAPIAEGILAHALPAIPALPARIIHGDLKISNVLFDGDRAHALIDLDTLQHGTIAIEIGDALRSWCNRAGEDVRAAAVDETVFAAATGGYVRAARDWLTEGEIHSIVPGFETIALELASRFCLDAFEERYFRWDPERFASAAEHNRVRAEGQLTYARDIAKRRRTLEGHLRSLTST